MKEDNKKIKFLFILLATILVVEVYFVSVEAQNTPIPLVTGLLKYTSQVQSKYGNFGVGQSGIYGNIIFSSNQGRSCIIFDGHENSTCFQDNLKKIEYRYNYVDSLNELKFYPLKNSTTSMTIKGDGALYFDVDDKEGIDYYKWQYEKDIILTYNSLDRWTYGSPYTAFILISLSSDIWNKLLMCDYDYNSKFKSGLNCNGLDNYNFGSEVFYRGTATPPQPQEPQEGDIGYDVIGIDIKCRTELCQYVDVTIRIAQLKYVYAGTKKQLYIETPSLYLKGIDRNFSLPISGEWCGATFGPNINGERWPIFKCGDKFPDDRDPENGGCPPGYERHAWGHDAWEPMQGDIQTCFRK